MVMIYSQTGLQQKPPQPKTPEPVKVRKHGGGRGKPLDADDLALVVKLYQAGETYINIASKVGRSPKSIPKIVRNLKLPLRRLSTVGRNIGTPATVDQAAGQRDKADGAP